MLSWSSRRVPSACTLIGTSWRNSSRFVAVMTISVWSWTSPSCFFWTFGGGAVTSVAVVPGARDCVVGVEGVASTGGGVWAKAGVASAVLASSPRVSAPQLRSLIEAPLGYVTALRQTPAKLSITGAPKPTDKRLTVAQTKRVRLDKHPAQDQAPLSMGQGAVRMHAIPPSHRGRSVA